MAKEVERPAERLNKAPESLEDRIVFSGLSRVAAKALLAKLPQEAKAVLDAAKPAEFYRVLSTVRATLARAQAELAKVNRGPDGKPLAKAAPPKPAADVGKDVVT